MGCSSPSPTVSVYQRIFQKSHSYLVHEPGSLSSSSVYARILKKLAVISMKEYTSETQSKQAEREHAFVSHALYIGCHHNVWPRLKVDFLTSKDLNWRYIFSPQRSRFEVGLSTSNDSVKEIPSWINLVTWVLVNFRCQIVNQEELSLPVTAIL